MIEPYPLYWPEGQPETKNRERARFDVNFARARDGLIKEIEKLGGRSVTITSNVAVRRDGLPYANQSNPENPGVAVYFWRNGQMFCMACDRWNQVKDNLRAIQKSIEAIRGIERWGASAMVEKAVQAFACLPENRQTNSTSLVKYREAR